MKILVVDDNAIMRKLARHIIPSCMIQCGYDDSDVITVDNGQAAIDLVKAGYKLDARINLIFLDLLMPDMDGHTTLEQIRAAEDELTIPEIDRVKVIICSACSGSEDVDKSFRTGCDTYIVKPISSDRLISAIHHVLGDRLI